MKYSAERKFGSEYWENVEALKEQYLDVSLNPKGVEQCELIKKPFENGRLE